MDCVKIDNLLRKEEGNWAIRKMPLRKGWEYPTRLFQNGKEVFRCRI